MSLMAKSHSSINKLLGSYIDLNKIREKNYEYK